MATETAVDVVMPQMGVSVSEGTITRWLKQEGEQVEADEPLLEISTDKVDTEVPSPASGTLTQILVPGGRDGRRRHEARPDRRRRRRGRGGACRGDAAGAGGRSGGGRVRRDALRRGRDARRCAGRRAATRLPSPRARRRAPSENGKAFVSPVVARIASEHGVDPARIQGSGKGGRVTKRDILAFVEGGGAEQAGAAQPQAAPQQAQPQAARRSRRNRRPRRSRRRPQRPRRCRPRRCSTRRARRFPARRSSR